MNGIQKKILSAIFHHYYFSSILFVIMLLFIVEEYSLEWNNYSSFINKDKTMQAFTESSG